MHTTTHPSRFLPLSAAVLAASVTAIAIFVLGRASGSAEQHALLLGGAATGGLLGLWFGLRHAPAIRLWSIGGVLATLGLALALGGLLSQPTEVNEQVVVADVDARDAMEQSTAVEGDAKGDPDAMAAPAAMAKEEPARNVLLSQGELQPLEHAGRGTASIIRTAEGRTVLTLTGFESDAGPDLEVWLVAGNPKTDSDVEGGRHVSLGRLKGTSGDQQYVLPKDVDPSDFSHAYIWCRAFSVGFSRATLA